MSGRAATAIAAALVAAMLAAGPAAGGPRIASINMCTDQLLLDLADPSEIVGLSPFARDVGLSWAAEKAGRLPVLSGTAEEIMVLEPTLVLASRYTKRTTRDFIKAWKIPMEEFDTVRSIAEAKDQIARVGRLVGAEQEAEKRIAAIEAGLAALSAAGAGRNLRVLPLSRRGWVSGQESLVGDLLARAGLVNAAGEAGLRGGGFLTLEGIVKLRPDAILVHREDGEAEDQGSALLLHPAIARLFPPERRIVVPESLTVCGGPMLIEAMDRLTAQMTRLEPRR